MNIMKKGEKNLSKRLLTSAWAGIILIILMIIGIIVSLILQNNEKLASTYSLIHGLIFNLVTLVFFYGFYLIGKKYNSNFLKVTTILMMIFVVVSYLVGIVYINSLVSNAQDEIINLNSTINEQIMNSGYDLNSLSEEQSSQIAQLIFPEVLKIILPFIIWMAVYFLFLFIFSILFGVAFIKISKNVKLAKITGILKIIGAVTAIILIGFIILFVAYILEIIILFKESKKH